MDVTPALLERPLRPCSEARENRRDSGELGALRLGAVGTSPDSLLIQAHRVTDGALRSVAAPDVLHVDRLALEHLVVLEEALDLLEPMRRQVRRLLVVREIGRASCRERVWITM